MAGLRSQERVISIHPDHFMCFTCGLAAGTASLLKLISGALAGRNGLLKSLVPLRGSSWLLPPSEHMLNRALLVSLTLLGQMKDVANGNKTPRTDEGKSRGTFTGGVWKKDEPKTRRAGQRRNFVEQLKNHKSPISLIKISKILIII